MGSRGDSGAVTRSRSPIVAVALVVAVVLVIGGALGLRACDAAPDTERSRTGVPSSRTSPTAAGKPVVLSYTIGSRRPHDTGAWTEGLLFESRAGLLESTGRFQHSELRSLTLETGEVRTRVKLRPDDYGEGLARAGDRLVQLTYQQGVAYQYDAESFVRTGELHYANEGWGLGFDPSRKQLVMSNGSAELTLRDPRTFAVTKTLKVTSDGMPVVGLNELEVVEGVVWANVWPTDEIVRIELATGRVTGVLNVGRLRSLAAAKFAGSEVANGIAHRPGDPPTRLWVTGKLWPTMFEIDLGGR